MKKLTDKILSVLEKLSTQQLMLLGGALVVFMVIMIVIALGGGDGDGESVEKVAPAKTRVVVAKKPIAARTQLSEDMLEVVEVASELAPAGALSDVADVKGKFVSYTLAAGDAVTLAKLLDSSGELGFAGMIPAHLRAISIAVDASSAIGGFAHPGDHVDINLVRGTGVNVNGELILQNVLLLAVNESAADPQAKAAEQAANAEEGDKKESAAAAPNNAGPPPAVVTVAVTPEQAILLATSMKEGTLYMTLRPYKPLDPFIVETEYKSPGAIKQEMKEASEEARQAMMAAQAAAPPVEQPNPMARGPEDKPKGPMVTIIRGGKVEEEELK